MVLPAANEMIDPKPVNAARISASASELVMANHAIDAPSRNARDGHDSARALTTVLRAAR